MRAGRISILDVAKHRIARYDLKGRFVGQLPGVSDVADDLAPVWDGFLVIQSEGDGVLKVIGGRDDGRVLHDNVLLPDGTPDNAYMFAFAADELSAWTSTGLHPLRPDLTLDRRRFGVETPDGLVDVRAIHEDTLAVLLSDGKRIQLAFHGPRKEIEAIVSVDSLQVVNGNLWLFVNIGQLGDRPSRYAGLYFLGLDPSGHVLTSEHLAKGSTNVPNQQRRGYIDEQGNVWQMSVRADGVSVNRGPNVLGQSG